MPHIFISYRRNDSQAVTGRLRDRLAAHYGNEFVFMDVDAIPLGHDFRQFLEKTVLRSEVMLVLIGRRWELGIQEPHDLVRLEIEIALENNIPVIPVLVNDAAMPNPNQLPERLRGLAYRHAVVIDSGRDFNLHVERLIRSIDYLERPPSKAAPLAAPEPARSDTKDERELTAALKKLTRAFFAAAEHPTKDGKHTQLLGPEPIWIARAANPEQREIAEFSTYLAPGKRGFLVYEGALPGGTSNALDRLRVEGKAIIPINANAMSAALADGNARALLSDLERGYESKDNLFDTRNALVDERFLFGRSELLTQVGSALARGEHVLVTGLRKCGKTSFLNILRQHLKAYPVCTVDLQRFDRHTEDWPSALFRLMVDTYDKWGRHTFGDDWPASAEHDGAPASAEHDWAPTTASELEALLSARRRWQIERRSHERMILIMDEAERVFPAEGEVKEAQKYVRAAGALRVLAQAPGERWLSIIAADLRPWLNRRNNLADGSTNPFFSFFQEVPLPLLSPYAVGELIRVIGNALDITRVDEAFVDQLFELSGGHPSITRMIAGASYTARGNQHELIPEDLDKGLTAMADNDEPGFFFRGNLWGLMTDEEKATLRSAAASPARDGFVGRLRGLIGRRDGPRYPEAAANLNRQGILHNGRITIGSLRNWIREPGNAEA
jgi:hypothetical protein